MSVKVFLSYAREDENRVGNLYDMLDKEGLNPWMDKRDILGGEDWERSIWRALQDSDFFLLCLSENSVNKRGFLRREIKRAQEEWEGKLQDDIYFIPLRLDACDPPDQIKDRFHWIDMFEEDGFDSLIQSIQVGAKRRNLEWMRKPERTKGSAQIVQANYSEERDGAIPYSIDIEYPRVEGPDEEWISEINRRLQGLATSKLHHYRKRYLRSLHDEELGAELGPSGFNEVSFSQSVGIFDQNLLSVAFNVSWYGAGAAHSNSHTLTRNFQTEPTFSLELNDLFHSEAEYLPRLSEICIRELTKQAEDYGSDDYDHNLMEDERNRKGVAPEEENFESFYLSPDGLHILFDKYQVGPGAWGCREVEIPYDDLGDVIDSTGPLRDLLTGMGAH